MVFHVFGEVLGPGCLAACAALCRPVAACGPLRQRIGSPNIKISDSGGLDLEAWCLDVWMLEGLEWIGGGDGGDGILGRGVWKKFSHARASGARRIIVVQEVTHFRGNTVSALSNDETE